MAGRASGFLHELEASFDASIAREEDIAANDLARALRNVQALRDVLLRSSGCDVRLEDGTTLPLAALGRTTLVSGTGEVLVRFERAVFVLHEPSSPPAVDEHTWLRVARSLAADRVKVQVRVHDRTLEGWLQTVARDFLTLEDARGATLVPHGSISYLRSCPGD